VQLAFRKPEEDFNYKQLSLNLINDGNLNLAKIPTDRGLQQKSVPFLTLANKILKEITFKLEYLYDYGMPHKAAEYDKMLSMLKPQKIFLGRHKFYHFRIWYRDYLDTYIKDILLDDRTLSRPYFDRKLLRTAIQDHLEGRRNYTSEITCLLTMELLHRNLVEKF
jgi:asparagine synthase (glutamine-hydrolysing)